ncbi:hypothetical protein [Streptomyces sp. CC224B]|uniref:hypothetical protein n=1 Tax=Streptomyces sp. CC224B TaxID=3044571 RepID=UPI0024A7BC51|nr:hypothetical protein [Streptomyces sp. CC224B]
MTTSKRRGGQRWWKSTWRDGGADAGQEGAARGGYSVNRSTEAFPAIQSGTERLCPGPGTGD